MKPQFSPRALSAVANIFEFALSMHTLISLIVFPLINLFGIPLAAAVFLFSIQCTSGAVTLGWRNYYATK
jgi:hypothetical protein